MSNLAKDLWEIFGANPPTGLSPQEKQELDADQTHRERLKEIFEALASKAEAARHDW